MASEKPRMTVELSQSFREGLQETLREMERELARVSDRVDRGVFDFDDLAYAKALSVDVSYVVEELRSLFHQLRESV